MVTIGHPIGLIVEYSPNQCAPSGSPYARERALLPTNDSGFGAHYRSWALESIIQMLRIEMLKAQLASRRYICASLANEFETSTLTECQRAALVHRMDNALKESHAVQLTLDLMAKQLKQETTSMPKRVPRL